jgi:hypothetical protein
MCFKSYMCCIGKTINVSDTDISVIFLYFLVDWHSDLKVPCSNVTKTMHVKIIGACML